MRILTLQLTVFMKAHLFDILLSLLTGIVSSIIAVLIIHIRSRNKFRKQLAKYIGEWKSYGLHQNRPNFEIQNAKVIIELQGTVLHLYHENKITDKKGVDWEAYMIINREFPNTGRINWQYIETSSYRDMGIKEFFLKETKTGFELYLIPINIGSQTYEFEVCVRNK